MKYLAVIVLLLCVATCHAADGYLAVSNGVMVIGPGGSGGGSATNAIANTNGIGYGTVTLDKVVSTNFTGDGSNLTNINASVTNLNQLVFATNAGNVTFVDLPVVSASAGAAERYNLNIAGTNALSIGSAADATSITNPTVNLHLSWQFGTNPLAAWPKAPFANGWAAIVSSNGYPYILLSTNAAAGQATWASTNKLGW